MNKKHILFFLATLLLLPHQIYTDNAKESFIDPKKYVKTNISSQDTSQKPPVQTILISDNAEDLEAQRKQQALDFVQSTEQRNEEKRQSRADAEKVEIVVDTVDEFISPTHTFVPIDAIVLDAGHGGKDPGGIGHKIEEKRLVLTLVKKLHTLFRKKNKKIKIYVTRKNDSFVSLEDRVSKTARWSVRKNVLFISIHANIAYNPKISGFEIYTLSDRASDTEALATERIENAGFTPEDIENTENVYSILADLIRDSTRTQSEWLARYVYDDTLKYSKVYGRGLKQANFFVLKYNTVPSILVEIGYMSNSLEAKELQNEEHQNNLAIGIFSGVSRYIQEYNKTEGFTK